MSSQAVDPMIEATGRPGEDSWIAQGIGKERVTLIGGQQIESKIGRVTMTQARETASPPIR